MNEYATNGRISLSAFYVRRCFRILPPLWFYLAIIAILSYLGAINTPFSEERLAAAFACNIPIVDCGNWYIIQTWSLAYEEQFYLLFPISALLISFRRKITFLVLSLVLPVAVVLCYSSKASTVATYLSVSQFLLVGVVMALFRKELKVYVRRLNSGVIYLSIGAFLTIDHLAASAFATTLKVAIEPPLIGLVLFYTNYFPCAINTALSLSAVRFIGRVSYGIYLWQRPATAFYPHGRITLYALLIGLMAIVCFASFFWIERALMNVGAGISRTLIKTGAS